MRPLKIPHEDIRYLSRDEIAAFGIDRREFAETPWFFAQFSNNTAYVSKWIVEARGPERKDYRVSVVMFGCSNTSRARRDPVYARAGERRGWRPVSATILIGEHERSVCLSGYPTSATPSTPAALFASGVGSVPLTAARGGRGRRSRRASSKPIRADRRLPQRHQVVDPGARRGHQDACGRNAHRPRSRRWADGAANPYVPAQRAACQSRRALRSLPGAGARPGHGRSKEEVRLASRPARTIGRPPDCAARGRR